MIVCLRLKTWETVWTLLFNENTDLPLCTFCVCVCMCVRYERRNKTEKKQTKPQFNSCMSSSKISTTRFRDLFSFFRNVTHPATKTNRCASRCDWRENIFHHHIYRKIKTVTLNSLTLLNLAAKSPANVNNHTKSHTRTTNKISNI